LAALEEGDEEFAGCEFSGGVGGRGRFEADGGCGDVEAGELKAVGRVAALLSSAHFSVGKSRLIPSLKQIILSAFDGSLG